MAFNLAPFNKTPFNIGSDAEIWMDALFAERVTPVVGSSSEIHLLAFGGEKIMRDGILGGNGLYITLVGSETISEGVTYAESTTVVGMTRFSETVTSQSSIQSDNFLNATYEETVGFPADSYIGCVIHPGNAKAAEKVSAEVITDKETYLAASGYEKVSESVTLEAVDIITCELDITLKPGDILVVDAINYNVWLNNENVNWIQKGEWIDELVRETSSISVEANVGSDQLSANILYTEAYL